MSSCIKNEKFNDSYCQDIILGKTKAKSALELMQSRYYAYKNVNLEYIQKTQIDNWSKAQLDEVENWAKNSFWQHLEIINYSETEVEFKAYYIYEGRQELIHELSTFVKQGDNWIYKSGKLYDTKVNIARNSKCICGSGKKYKQCCLKFKQLEVLR